MSRMMERLVRLVRNDRGDFIVTPAILALGVALTLVTAGLTYVAARNVAPGVGNSRQGVTLDDEGNVVQGGVGVIPVPTPTPSPTPEPTQAPRQVVRTQTPYQPTPTPYVYVSTDDPHETEDPYETEEPHDTIEPHETMDPHP